MVIRIWQECNGGWFPWGKTASAAQFIAAWRQIATQAKAVFPNARIDWNLNPGDQHGVNGGPGDGTGYDLYPGDDLVDIVSLDFYEKNVGQTWPAILTGAGPNLNNLAAFALAHNKLIGIGEWASHSCDGTFITNVAAWCDSMGSRMAYQSWYDQGLANNGDNVLWTTSTATSTDACAANTLRSAWQASSFGAIPFGGTWSPLITSPTRSALAGFYTSGVPPTLSTVLGYQPDYTINNSFQDSGSVSDGVSGLQFINGYPVVIDIDIGPNNNNTTDLDYVAAAAGSYTSGYVTKLQSLVPFASSIYAIRIDVEFNLHGNDPGTGWTTYYDRPNVGPTVYKAAFNALAAVCKTYLPNAKVIFNPNIENGSNVIPYFPGVTFCDVIGIDMYMQPQYNTTFAHYQGLTTNGLNQFAALSASTGAPMMLCEWADLFSDASNLAATASWIKAHNVVGHAYWNSNDALTTSSPNFSPVLTGAKLAAYQAAFANTVYGGTFFTHKATTTLAGY